MIRLQIYTFFADTGIFLPLFSNMEDFSRPKIVYPETTQGAYFAYDDKRLFIDKTCFMMITDHAEYLLHTLSSKLFEFAYKRIFSSVELGEHGYQYNKHALVKLPVLLPPDDIILTEANADETIYRLYYLSQDEIKYIEAGCMKSSMDCLY